MPQGSFAFVITVHHRDQDQDIRDNVPSLKSWCPRCVFFNADHARRKTETVTNEGVSKGLANGTKWNHFKNGDAWYL